ncbi:MAG: hypothetical protein ACOX3V_05495 [Bacillota bacterium]
MKRSLILLVAIACLGSMLLAACGSPDPGPVTTKKTSLAIAHQCRAHDS